MQVVKKCYKSYKNAVRSLKNIENRQKVFQIVKKYFKSSKNIASRLKLLQVV